MVLGTVLIAVLLLASASSPSATYLVEIPPANAAATAQSNVYLYADGSQLARDGEVNRENVSLAQIPQDAQHAVLAAEDRDFYTESAVDPKAMLRAAWNTVTGKGKQSGSTITQQYVKNYYLGQEQTVTRKVKEFFISIKLDREESKDHILEGYLNTSYFGRNAYGIQAAAQAYYGVDADGPHHRRRAPTSPPCSTPPARTTSSPTPRTRRRPSPAGTTSSTAWSRRSGSARPTAPRMTFPDARQAKGPAGLSGQRGYLVAGRQRLPHRQRRSSTRTPCAGGGYRITTTLQKTQAGRLRQSRRRPA